MEAICFSETSVDMQRTAQRYVPEDSTLHNHRCENLKSYMFFDVLEVVESVQQAIFLGTTVLLNKGDHI
jgi:hypothetical protein